MAHLTTNTRDYIIESLDAPLDADLVQAVLMRLNVHRGKYWANPDIGSRFYLMRRAKDVPRNLLLAKQYADEALDDLVPARAQSIITTAQRIEKGRIDLHIEITRLTGEKQIIIYFIQVGG